jgi:cAMP phosphodiesterase
MSDEGMKLYSDCILGKGGAVLSLRLISVGGGGGMQATYSLEVSRSERAGVHMPSQLIVDSDNLYLIRDMLNSWYADATEASKPNPPK